MANYISLASGIGGLDLGVAIGSGGTVKPVCYVEHDLTAASVLATHMEEDAIPFAPIWSDIRTFDAAAWRGIVDGVVAGFPCQPYSVAGRQRGAADPRDLWDDCLRVLVESGATWGFFENVGGAKSTYVNRFGPDLERHGYKSRGAMVRASDVGAPHRRERLFFVAYAEDVNGWSGITQTQTRTGPDEKRGWGPSISGESMANAEGSGLEGRLGSNTTPITGPRQNSRNMGDTSSIRRRSKGDYRFTASRFDRTGSELYWPPGPNADWSMVPESLWPSTIKSEIRGMANGLSRTMALRLLGNSVVPQQAALAWTILGGSQ